MISQPKNDMTPKRPAFGFGHAISRTVRAALRRLKPSSALSTAAYRDLFDKRICDLRTDDFLRDPTLTDVIAPLVRTHFAPETATIRARLSSNQPAPPPPRLDAMRIVLTNRGLEYYAGSELWTSDIAKYLVRNGVATIAYAPALGAIAEQMAAAGVQVTASIDEVEAFAPNLLHVNHFEAVTPLIERLRGQVVLVNMIHGLLPRPGLPGLEHVDRYCCVSIHARIKTHLLTETPWEAIETLPNFFDEQRFAPISRTGKSAKALLFTSRTPPEQRERLRKFLAPLGFSLDHVGYGGQVTTEPERLLPLYDIVFAVGRSAIEALASGCRVILWDFGIIGPAVTAANFWQCVVVNFDLAANALSWRFIDDPTAGDWIRRQIAAFDDREDATTDLTRRYLSLSAAGARLLSMYDADLRQR
jgi:hypothetical protein